LEIAKLIELSVASSMPKAKTLFYDGSLKNADADYCDLEPAVGTPEENAAAWKACGKISKSGKLKVKVCIDDPPPV
jgi:hypothetical protein